MDEPRRRPQMAGIRQEAPHSATSFTSGRRSAQPRQLTGVVLLVVLLMVIAGHVLRGWRGDHPYAGVFTTNSPLPGSRVVHPLPPVDVDHHAGLEEVVDGRSAGSSSSTSSTWRQRGELSHAGDSSGSSDRHLPIAPNTTSEEGGGGGGGRKLPHSGPRSSKRRPRNVIIPIQRNYFAFGDSLTSGGYYVDGPKKPIFRQHPYGSQLARKLTGVARRDQSDTTGNVAIAAAARGRDVSVAVGGYPGANTKALLRHVVSKHSQNVAVAQVGLVLAGTNDVIGRKEVISTAVGRVVQIHQVFWQRGVRTVGMLLPPMNYTAGAAAVGSRYEKGYCSSSADAEVQRRRVEFNKLLGVELRKAAEAAATHLFPLAWAKKVGQDGSPVEYLPPLFPQLFDFEAAGVMHRDIDDQRSFWSDCLHPNEAGYDRFGAVIADYLTRAARRR